VAEVAGALESGGDLLESAKLAIDQSSEAELIEAITALADIDAEQLREVRDLHAYAKRLAEIALSGVLAAPAENGAAESPEPLEVRFSEAVDAAHAAIAPSDRFYPQAGRIYAEFDSNAIASEQVVAKWFRIDVPEILLVGQYPVETATGHSYVGFGPKGRWSPGDYRVEFYAANETAEKLAEGTYVVSNER